MTNNNLMQDKIIQTQLDILQLNNMYNELNSFVSNIISIGNGDKRLIIQGQIFHVNEHNYICNADQLKCVWDINASEEEGGSGLGGTLLYDRAFCDQG